MTSKFDGFEYEGAESLDRETELPTDCFELLSSYIDGELSPSERNKVQVWLDRDPEVKNTYTQLLALQGKMQQIAAPPSDKSAEEITAGVFKSIDRDRRRQRRLAWGGSAIAVSILAALGFIPGTPSGLRLAERHNSDERSDAVMLAVAINKPAIDIPKSVNGYEAKEATFVDN